MNEFDLKARDWDANPERLRRANAVADAIRAQLKLSADMNALEYGCGTGQLSFALREELGDITAADSSDGMLDVLRTKVAETGAGNIHPVRLDLTTDPLPDERFAIIFTMMTLHHIPDTESILRVFHQLLTDQGVLCVADLDKEDGSFHGADFTGHKGFDRHQLSQLAQKAGFSHVRFSTAFHMRKETGQNEQEFPVFLMVAEK